MTTFATVWFWRGERLTETWHNVARFTSDVHPHPFLLETPVRPDDPTLVTETVHEDGLFRVVSHVVFPEAPQMYYVLAEMRNALVSLSAISAFGDGKFPDGTVLSFGQAKDAGLDGLSKVGALSWVSSTGVMQQITVDERWRRRKISTKLIEVADTLIVASGADAFLTGGEFTTSDGEKLREAWANSVRVNDRRGEAVL
jgi:hypothetical protein